MAIGYLSTSHTDFDDEHSNHRIYTTVLTAANFDAQAALRASYQSAVEAIVRGIRWKYEFGTLTVNNVGNSSDPFAQVELKWFVSYHDNVTFKKYRVELPCADTEQLDPNDRSHAHIGDAGVVDAFVTAFEAYGLSEVGNAITVDEITLVGRPI
jgi:hypothetical protein